MTKKDNYMWQKGIPAKISSMFANYQTAQENVREYVMLVLSNFDNTKDLPQPVIIVMAMNIALVLVDCVNNKTF